MHLDEGIDFILAGKNSYIFNESSYFNLKIKYIFVIK